MAVMENLLTQAHQERQSQTEACFHCGEPCNTEEQIQFDNKDFCCEGCKMVYTILNENDLCTYYDLDKNPGKTQKIKVRKDKFAFLDNAETAAKLISFQNGPETHVSFYLPQIHCSSCIWLLEFLHKLQDGILESRADFTRKEVKIIYNAEKTSLRNIAELLTGIGYEPHISFNDIATTKKGFVNRSILIQLGIAGFGFGNIMLLSFPEYFGISGESSLVLTLFSYLNLALGTLVFFVPARTFFVSAWKGMQQRFLNIDAPVALAILITYGRSVFEIVTQTGPGFMDSMSGIVFFMLTGRFYQDYSQNKLSFDRDFKSFFPAAVTKIVNQEEIPATLDQLKAGDTIRIHHKELIPADGLLLRGHGKIDYSFVTGEAEAQSRQIGELLYAGGRQVGQSIEIQLTRAVSQSYLTSLWEQNKGNFEEKKRSFSHQLAKNFTLVLFAAVALTALFWAFIDPGKIFNTVTAMLIIACPCALLLAVTFTNGSILSILSKNGLFLRNPVVLESLAETTTIFFDKTGTLTHSGETSVETRNMDLNLEEKEAIFRVSSQSVHPLSRAITQFIRPQLPIETLQKPSQLALFEENAGKGLEGTFKGIKIKIGTSSFLGIDRNLSPQQSHSHLLIDGAYKGCFVFKNKYRQGVDSLLEKLQKQSYKTGLISGDKPSEKETLSQLFPENATLLFEQLPEDKKNTIQTLQEKGEKVLMLGDGLNDAIALAQSHSGIAVTDDTNLLSPACDGILKGDMVPRLDDLLYMAKANMRIIYFTFGVSLLYNSVGLYFAVQGLLSPLIAAIIMPSMTFTIIIITSLSSRLLAIKRGLKV
jgi:Cu+-exporting ATPase